MFSSESIIKILIPQKFPWWLTTIKVIFIIFSCVLLAAIIYFIIFTDYFYYRFFEFWDDLASFRKRKTKKKEKKQEIKKELTDWERILTRFKEEREIGWKMSLIDADRLLKQKIEELKKEGKNFDERISNLEEIKEAKKVLKKVLEEEKISKSEIEKAVLAYHRAYQLLDQKP